MANSYAFTVTFQRCRCFGVGEAGRWQKQTGLGSGVSPLFIVEAPAQFIDKEKEFEPQSALSLSKHWCGCDWQKQEYESSDVTVLRWEEEHGWSQRSLTAC